MNQQKLFKGKLKLILVVNITFVCGGLLFVYNLVGGVSPTGNMKHVFGKRAPLSCTLSTMWNLYADYILKGLVTIQFHILSTWFCTFSALRLHGFNKLFMPILYYIISLIFFFFFSRKACSQII